MPKKDTAKETRKKTDKETEKLFSKISSLLEKERADHLISLYYLVLDKKINARARLESIASDSSDPFACCASRVLDAALKKRGFKKGFTCSRTLDWLGFFEITVPYTWFCSVQKEGLIIVPPPFFDEKKSPLHIYARKDNIRLINNPEKSRPAIDARAGEILKSYKKHEQSNSENTINTPHINRLFTLNPGQDTQKNPVFLASFKDVDIFLDSSGQILKFRDKNYNLIRAVSFYERAGKILIKGLYIWDSWEWLVFGENPLKMDKDNLEIRLTRNNGREFSRLILPEVGLGGKKYLLTSSINQKNRDAHLFIGHLEKKGNFKHLGLIETFERCRYFDGPVKIKSSDSPVWPVSGLNISRDDKMEFQPPLMLDLKYEKRGYFILLDSLPKKIDQKNNLPGSEKKILKNFQKIDGQNIYTWQNFTKKNFFTISFPGSWTTETAKTGSDQIYNFFDKTKILCISVRAVKKNKSLPLTPSEILAVLENEQYSYFIVKGEYPLFWSGETKIVTEYSGPLEKPFNAKAAVFENSSHYFVLLLINDINCSAPALKTGNTVFSSFRTLF